MSDREQDVRYVTLNPTGNLTCLVLGEPEEDRRPAITAALMKRCEQVGYLERSVLPGCRARLQMMGGEFCGNAAMATAAWLCRQEDRTGVKERRLLLEVSGAEGPTECRVRALPEGDWEGTVTMPGVLAVRRSELDGQQLTVVSMEGITHLIREGEPMEKGQAEEFLRRAAGNCPAEALGLLQWDADRGFMTPLVYVRGSCTLVWESGCGSGSTALGAWQALRRGEGCTETAIYQPGGCIRVKAKVQNGRVAEIAITGRVLLGEEEMLSV